MLNLIHVIGRQILIDLGCQTQDFIGGNCFGETKS